MSRAAARGSGPSHRAATNRASHRAATKNASPRGATKQASRRGAAKKAKGSKSRDSGATGALANRLLPAAGTSRARGRAAGAKASKSRPNPRRSEGRERSPASPQLRRRRFILVVSAAFAALVLGTSFPASGLLSEHRQIAATDAALHRLKSENTALAQEKQQLNSKAEIHRLARQDYQLVDPGQTAYNVLPPNSQSSKNSSSSVIGDPGNKPLVAPANAAGMSPDPGAPTTSTTSPSSSAGQVPSSSGSGTATPTTQPSSASGGFWTRTLRSLEFWR
ncbi:MAG TPA: septum formation initiator family protein [Acidimicrobiales bacterium]|nr:septum formation initiator family protein [Acidimicrobiales bacterium]